MTRMVNCVKLGAKPKAWPSSRCRGDGQENFRDVSKEAWAGWQRHQTMLINENRLNLADPQARSYLMEQMERYFFGAAM